MRACKNESNDKKYLMPYIPGIDYTYSSVWQLLGFQRQISASRPLVRDNIRIRVAPHTSCIANAPRLSYV